MSAKNAARTAAESAKKATEATGAALLMVAIALVLAVVVAPMAPLMGRASLFGGFTAGEYITAGDIAKKVGYGLQTVKRAMRLQGFGCSAKFKIAERRKSDVMRLIKEARDLGLAIGMTREEMAAFMLES